MFISIRELYNSWTERERTRMRGRVVFIADHVLLTCSHTRTWSLMARRSFPSSSWVMHTSDPSGKNCSAVFDISSARSGCSGSTGLPMCRPAVVAARCVSHKGKILVVYHKDRRFSLWDFSPQGTFVHFKDPCGIL